MDNTASASWSSNLTTRCPMTWCRRSMTNSSTYRNRTDPVRRGTYYGGMLAESLVGEEGVTMPITLMALPAPDPRPGPIGARVSLK